MVSSQEIFDLNVSHDEVQQRVSPRREITLSQGIDDVAKNELSDSNAMACELVSSHSSPLMQHSQSPNTPSHELSLMQSNQYTRSIIREKVRKDGYKWLKYGQKIIKKNPQHKRGYYKCTHSNCKAGKKFHWSDDGNIEYFTYTSQHNHPNPQLSIEPQVDHVLPVVEHVQHQLSMVDVEVQDNNNIDATRAGVLTSESRLVVQTSSANYVVNDVYRWHKYGRKIVKGKTIQRNYFRCSYPGCPVKKYVDKSSQKSTNVVTTYEGQHDHGPPTGGGVPHNITTNTQKMGINGEPEDKSEGNTICDDMTPFGTIILPNQGLESELNEEEQQNEDFANDARICGSSYEVLCRLNEHGTPSTKSDAELDHIKLK